MPGGLVAARPASGDAGRVRRTPDPVGAPLDPAGGPAGRLPGDPAPKPAQAPEQAPAPATPPSRPRASKPAHRAPRNTHRGAMAVAGVLVAVGAAATTFLLVGPGAGLDGTPGSDGTVLSGPPPSPIADADTAVTCWNGATTDSARACSVPTGRAGLTSVFASVSDSCASTTPLIPGKVEVLTCNGDGYVVRYTRWKAGFDRFATFGEANAVTGAADPGQPWRVAGKFAGREWRSTSATADGVVHYRWTATYRAWPLSVEVQATSARGLSSGIASVKPAAPQRVGR